MSLAVAQGTSLFIILRKAQLEYRLLQITNDLQQLAWQSSQDSQDLLTRYQSSLAQAEGTDEPSVIADVMSSDEFTIAYNNMTLQYQAKEKMLTAEKTQLETQYKALETEEEDVDKLIESNIKSSFGYFNN